MHLPPCDGLSDLVIALQSEDEREMCSRTVYCTNIDKKVVFNDMTLNSNLETMGVYSILNYLSDCRSLRQMSSSSLNQFAGRFVDANFKSMILVFHLLVK